MVNINSPADDCVLISLQQEMMDVSITYFSAWYVVESGEARFHYL
jgi:hypothetical protein